MANAFFDDELKATIERDPIAEFELLTGKSCHGLESGEDKMSLLSHAMAVNLNKRAALAMTGDSHFGMTLDEYAKLIESLGFRLVASYQFRKEGYSHDDTLFIYWEASRACLLSFDSWSGKSVNSGQFAYCWKPHNGDYSLTSSGGRNEDGVWSGDHDCREAIAYKLRRLDAGGEFVQPWPRIPFLWLVGYGEDTDRSKEIRDERLAAFPDDIRRAIGVE